MRPANTRRIAYLCLETPREGQATHTHVHEIINGLRANGWDVSLIATEAGGSASGSAYWRRGLDYISAQWRLMRGLSAYDAVYMRAHFAALPASLYARLRGKPVVQEINGKPDDIFVTYPWLGWLGWPVKASYRWQMQLAAHVITVTEGLRGWALAEAGHAQVSLVGNGANTDVFTPEGPKPEGEGQYIAFVGGITAWHGIDVMVAATSNAAWPEGVKLVIIGDGKESGQLRAAMLSDGQGRIQWLGRLPQQQAAMWLRGALGALSITQDTSEHLGTGVAPLKLFEAMASGAAVIVTDLPFQADLVSGEDAGLVIPMADPAALAEAIARLAADPAAAWDMGARGAAYVRENASWMARAAETGLLIEDAIQRGSAHAA
ncbi:MAG: glycosyltransferase [Bosea sp. (in: a-proteobacteria)]